MLSRPISKALLALVCVLWASVVQAQVAYEASLAPVAVTFDAAGETETTAFNAGTGSNRLLLVVVFWRDSDDSAISGVTYNSVSMTSLGAKLRSAQNISIQGFRLSGPASGSNNIAVTMGAAGGSSAALINAWVGNTTDGTVDGFATTSGTTVLANAVSTSDVTTSSSGDRAVFFFGSRNLVDNYTATAANYTERQDGNNGTGLAATYGDAAGAGATINATATWNNGATTFDWVSLGINVNQASAAPTCTGRLTLLGAGKCE